MVYCTSECYIKGNHWVILRVITGSVTCHRKEVTAELICNKAEGGLLGMHNLDVTRNGKPQVSGVKHALGPFGSSCGGPVRGQLSAKEES